MKPRGLYTSVYERTLRRVTLLGEQGHKATGPHCKWAQRIRRIRHGTERFSAAGLPEAKVAFVIGSERREKKRGRARYHLCSAFTLQKENTRT